MNCTSLGLAGDAEVPPPELPVDGIRPGQVVADIVYRPGGTAWLSEAARRGATTVDGLGMLLHQGADAFAQWTEREPPVEVMERALAGSAGT